MSLTSVFGLGSEPTAACGGRKEVSEWQRSAEGKSALSDAGFAGHRNRKQVDPVTCSNVKVRPPTFVGGLCVRVTYLPGQSPAKYCRRK